MTPEAAIEKFFEQFGISVFAATAVPHDIEFPYLTYELVVGGWGQAEANMPVNIWFRTDSEAVPNAKVREISEAIGLGGVSLPCDGGFVWLKKGSPWSQAVRVEGDDDKVKRRYVNVNVEYLALV